MGHSASHNGPRCPHCSGKLPGFVSRDAELRRIREETQKDAEVARLSNQLTGAVSRARVDAALVAWDAFRADNNLDAAVGFEDVCETLDLLRGQQTVASAYEGIIFDPLSSDERERAAATLQAQLAGAAEAERGWLSLIVKANQGDVERTLPTLSQMAEARLAELGGR